MSTNVAFPTWVDPSSHGCHRNPSHPHTCLHTCLLMMQGISLANLSDYDQSARYYVRALALNPRASGVWGYLRCVGLMAEGVCS